MKKILHPRKKIMSVTNNIMGFTSEKTPILSVFFLHFVKVLRIYKVMYKVLRIFQDRKETVRYWYND